ncbi:anti-sigma factor [Microbacterium sp. C7(2022)]|uniref:anti-sigma factor n=1 Tax=Microbacterium sp. C7(2022) TaxID=2992759 RepID=UPI00237A6163|nr:anti-sigma factor [Microbacterium sp. C7(2022)]MDE0545910.1 anti-sigma factor [Microbacterium sp. C7(2022)]
MIEYEFVQLAAGYALGALSPEDREAFEAARALHPEWEHHVRADLDTAAELADAVPQVAPPPHVRADLLALIAQTPQDEGSGVDAAPALATESDEPVTTDEGTTAEDEEPRAPMHDPAPTTATIQTIERRRWTRGLFGLAASLLLLVALGLGAASIGELIGPSPAVVALNEIEAAPDAEQETVDVTGGGTATLHWSNSLGRAVLVSDGLPAIAEDQSFELWYIRGDEAPIAAGTFESDPDAATTALVDGRMQAGDVIAVTIEEAGGSPTGEPTSNPILAIPTA